MLLGEVITRSIHRAPCAAHSRRPINDNRKNELWREKESTLHGGGRGKTCKPQNLLCLRISGKSMPQARPSFRPN